MATEPKPSSLLRMSMHASDWSHAVMHLGCTEAQENGWLADDWRAAWWAQKGAAKAWGQVYEAGDVVRWQGAGRGAVWLACVPDWGVRWLAACAGPRGEAVTDRETLRELAGRDAPEAWVWWFQLLESIKPRMEWTVAAPGMPAVVTYGPAGEAVIGPVVRVRKGAVLTVLDPEGFEVEVNDPKRSWAFNARWREAAAQMMAEGAPLKYASAQSAQWTVINRRKKMERQGVLPKWE